MTACPVSEVCTPSPGKPASPRIRRSRSPRSRWPSRVVVTTAHNPHGEDSWGLWQMNVAPGVRQNHSGGLSDPLVNARAAYQISHHGTNMSPWTTTHDSSRGTSHDYRRYLDQVEAIAGGAHGDHNGVIGYGSSASSTHAPDPSPMGYDQIPSGAAPSAVDSDHDGLTDSFEAMAGTNPRATDSDHDGLSDAFEILRSHTDPRSADTDHDGVPDGVEYAMGTDRGSARQQPRGCSPAPLSTPITTASATVSSASWPRTRPWWTPTMTASPTPWRAPRALTPCRPPTTPPSRPPGR